MFRKRPISAEQWAVASGEGPTEPPKPRSLHLGTDSRQQVAPLWQVGPRTHGNKTTPSPVQEKYDAEYLGFKATGTELLCMSFKNPNLTKVDFVSKTRQPVTAEYGTPAGKPGCPVPQSSCHTPAVVLLQEPVTLLTTAGLWAALAGKSLCLSLDAGLVTLC